ncbi:MAG: type II secretion system F family protein [Endomicrobium sp.]|jgi:tight adherence protein B|uniref:type II secretion system F family protein n=1 Tax=Candidatus Endomicrobiellum cubanum TaxID=3242325 RepID=UPI0028280F96|nr:type II secretion system F family protein [Endomicrobium sp.]
MREILFLVSLSIFVFCLIYFILSINLTKNKKINKKIDFKNLIIKRKRFVILFGIFIVSFIAIENIIFSVILCILYSYFDWHLTYLKKQKISNLIDLQIVEALTIIKNSLQSGRTVINAIVDVKNELKEPIKSEFEQISDSITLGLSFDEAIGQVSSKTSSKEFKFVLNTIKISKDTGASLKDIFEQIIELISKRIATKSKVNALTSQGKLSGNIVTLVPFIIIFMMYLIEPDMICPLFVTLAGNILLLIVVIMVSLGSLVIRKITEIDF